MPVFICAVSTDGKRPAAYALVEQLKTAGSSRTRYAVRALDRFSDRDPVQQLGDLLATDRQHAGSTILVTTGGQRIADLFHDGGLSAVAVETGGGPSRDGDTISVAEQTLVDTFAGANRRGDVELPGSIDRASEAVAALYAAMSDDAGADDEEDFEEFEEDAAPDTIELSGSASSMSTAQIGSDRGEREMGILATGEVQPERKGHVEDRASSFGSADLGAARDTAVALALAVWYGEYSADQLPTTDQADETTRARQVRNKRQQAAREAAGQR
jgi:hypothetical protein